MSWRCDSDCVRVVQRQASSDTIRPNLDIVRSRETNGPELPLLLTDGSSPPSQGRSLYPPRQTQRRQRRQQSKTSRASVRMHRTKSHDTSIQTSPRCCGGGPRADSQTAKCEQTKAELRSVEHERKAAEKESASVEKRIKAQQARGAKVDCELVMA